MLLAELLKELTSLDKGLILYGKQYAREVRQSILAGVDAYAKRFIPNNRATIARKRSNKPLIAKGRLINSFDVKPVGRLGLIVYNKAPYSGLHNEGIGVPLRRFMDAEVAANKLASVLSRKFT